MIAEIKTTAGSYNAEIITPATGSGPWPGVILFFDAGGARPAMTLIAERIAKSGYVVAIPDLFHRAGSILKLVPDAETKGIAACFGEIFGNDEKRARFFSEYYTPALSYENLETDIGALLTYLHSREDVKPGPVGTTGYCMGGNASFRVATIFGDKIAATASFHGGGLVTDAPDSPHMRADKIKSTVYIAGAIEDGSFTDEAKAKLVAALSEAHVRSAVETYPAKHGFAVSDHAGVYDEAAAERHFKALESLYAVTLKHEPQ